MVAPADVIHTGKPSDVEPKPPTTQPPAAAGRKQTVQQLKTIIRTISKTGGNVAGSEPIVQIEAYLAEFFGAGWRLFAVTHLNDVPEGHTMAWTLVRDI
jgi:hypothetical protein